MEHNDRPVGNSPTQVTAVQLNGWMREHSPPTYIREILEPIAQQLDQTSQKDVCFTVGKGALELKRAFAGQSNR